jgi:hypothetical protein
VFAQVTTSQAQVTVDVAKVTCDELSKEETQWTSGEIILWLSGYHHGEGHNTIVQPSALKRDEDKLNQYCYGHGDATVIDAVKTWDRANDAAHALALIPFPRRFPPPWSVEETPACQNSEIASSDNGPFPKIRSLLCLAQRDLPLHSGVFFSTP